MCPGHFLEKKSIWISDAPFEKCPLLKNLEKKHIYITKLGGGPFLGIIVPFRSLTNTFLIFLKYGLESYSLNNCYFSLNQMRLMMENCQRKVVVSRKIVMRMKMDTVLSHSSWNTMIGKIYFRISPTTTWRFVQWHWYIMFDRV